MVSAISCLQIRVNIEKGVECIGDYFVDYFLEGGEDGYLVIGREVEYDVFFSFFFFGVVFFTYFVSFWLVGISFVF